MLDSSNNLTLQEINYEEQESISDISHIRYEDDYAFLNDFSFNAEHLALSHLRLQPHTNTCEIEFFEEQEKRTQPQTLQDQSHPHSPKYNRKIGTLTLREDSFLKHPIKLPLARSPILLRLESAENERLHGRLSKEEGDAEIALFDELGNRRGSLNYHLQTKGFSQEPPMLVEDDTLHSRDFMEEQPLVRKVQAPKDTPKKIETPRIPPPIEQTPKAVGSKKINPSNRRTLTHSTLEEPKPPLQNSDDEDAKSEKSEINYLGYENHSKIEERVAGYRLPVHENRPTHRKPVDYQTLKRSMQDLGLVDHFKVEAILHQRSPIQKQEPSVPLEASAKQAPGVLKVPDKSLVSTPAQSEASQEQVSFRDFSSQAERVSPEVIECGIGTYSPLPSRLNDERINNSSFFRHSKEFMKDESIQYDHLLVPQEYPQEQQPPLRHSHFPRTHLSRPKEVNSSFEADSFNQQEGSTLKQRASLSKESRSQQHQLSVRNNVYDIRVGSSRLNSGEGSRHSNAREWMSCKESASNNITHSEEGSDSALYPEVDIIVNNLSVNFHRKSFGAKLLQLSIPPTTYRTEALAGNNLIWIGKEYLFKGVWGNNELGITLKQAVEEVESTLGQVRIRVADLILNKKKCYFQTFLLSKKEVVAILIIGFQVARRTYALPTNRNLALPHHPYPLKATRQTHAQTEISRSKTTKIKRSPRKKPQHSQLREEGLPSPRLNPIRVRKYQGGRNIKIGRASRFAHDGAGVPGPGDYHIESEFSRHALKDL